MGFQDLPPWDAEVGIDHVVLVGGPVPLIPS